MPVVDGTGKGLANAMATQATKMAHVSATVTRNLAVVEESEAHRRGTVVHQYRTPGIESRLHPLQVVDVARDRSSAPVPSAWVVSPGGRVTTVRWGAW
jgi:hypothetical protein